MVIRPPIETWSRAELEENFHNAYQQLQTAQKKINEQDKKITVQVANFPYSLQLIFISVSQPEHETASISDGAESQARRVCGEGKVRRTGARESSSCTEGELSS